MKGNQTIMAIDIIVPPLSQTMDSLILVRWEKQIGDPVSKGDILFVVETDKATLEVESPGSGILSEILAEPGSEIIVRSKIGTLLSDGESMPVKVKQVAQEKESSELQGLESMEIENPVSKPETKGIFSSPRARKLAKRMDVSLENIKATGPRQMIIERDIITFLEMEKEKIKITPKAKQIAEEKNANQEKLRQINLGKTITRKDVGGFQREQSQSFLTNETIKSKQLELTNIRKVISRRMHESHQTTAPVTLICEADASELKFLRERILQNLKPGAVHPSYTDLLIIITARCLKKHPIFNGTFINNVLESQEDIHMAFAVDTERGLIVPVIHSVQDMSLSDVANARNGLVQRVIKDEVDSIDLSGGTFTITNLGTQGIDAFTPIINRPQIGILGIGRICPAAMVYEGKLAIRERIYLSLTFDHRIVDGAPAARFLKDIVDLIEKPNEIKL
ncbi:MAG: 2-oxo acid dehydrogenase subunit E2 [Desulfobacterales bacterium]|nr:2-oxo acid dehydrogenase subunit E2 [Desulfobacterales bacterium]